MSPRRREGWATELLGRQLAERADHGRLVRGMELHELGRVHDLDLAPGRATATVGGSRSEPYRVTVRVPMTGRTIDASKLRFDCSCPDWGDPCKHGVALVLEVAEHFDAEPEAAVRWWGQDPPAKAADRRTTAPPVGSPAAARRQPALRTERPAWAEGLPEPGPPATVDQWLGVSGRVRPMLAAKRPPAAATLDELGSLEVAPGVDLAAALRALLHALADGRPGPGSVRP